MLLKPIIEDDDLIEEAIQAYFKKYSKNGNKPMQPSAIASSIGKKFVYLRSGELLLAKYNYKTKKI